LRAFKLESVEALRRQLAEKHCTYEVRRSEDGATGWQRVDALDCQPFDASLPLPILSSKGFFFADRDPLYKYDGQAFKDILPEVEPKVLFGVKSCDLVAINYQDQFFAKDRHYQERRQKTVLVGVDCQSPCDKGFCPKVDAGPYVRDHTADMILAANYGDLDFPWLLVVVNEESLELLGDLELAPAAEGWAEARAHGEKAVVANFPPQDYVDVGIKCINDGSISSEEWQGIGTQCMSCSGCTSVCPTCSCYDTYEYDNESGETVTARCWDSCQFESFQRAAGNVNPSQDSGSRSKRFWYHKFSDDFLPEFGRYGCVGCGRCEQTCPSVVGVHTVMHRLADAQSIVVIQSSASTKPAAQKDRDGNQ